MTGYAHHPYTRGGSRPPLSRTNAGEITIGVASRLTRLLDQAARAKRIPARLPIHYTEHGWQTNPPDRIFGVTDAQQAEYMNQSDWIAYNNARVHTVAQYKIVDDENIGAGFQMGLRLFSGGARKPAYDAYKLPIWVSGNGSNVTVYGQVRPADNGRGGLRRRPGGGRGRRSVQDRADGPGHVGRTAPSRSTVPRAGAVWRLRWNGMTFARRRRWRRSEAAARGWSLATAAALCAAAAPAHAATFEVGMEDEGLLLSNPHLAPAAVLAWKAMGVDVVRIHARWWEIAPARTATRAPSGFNANNPNDPQYNWVALDNAIATDPQRRACARWSRSPAPARCGRAADTRKRNPLWKPKPAAYASFARAVGDALSGPRRPLSALERAQPEGLAAAAVAVRPPPPQLPAGVAAPLPLARARRAARDPRRRPRQRGRGRRAGAGRRSADQRPDADEAAARSCASWAAWTRAIEAIRTGSCRGFKAAAGRTPSATTRIRRSSRRTRSTRTRTRPSSPT